MTLVTISDHNTVAGALRIAHEPDTFLSVEVTTRFPEDDVPLHVLVWNLTEEDHRDLQPYRPSVYELVRFLRERALAHALAHSLGSDQPRDPFDLLQQRPRCIVEQEVRFVEQEHKFWLIEIADLVTEMTLVKHSFQAGVKAQKGIEF